MTHLCFRCLAAYTDDLEECLSGCGGCDDALFVKVRAARVHLVRTPLQRASLDDKQALREAIEDAVGEEIEREGIVVLDADSLVFDDDGYRITLVHRLTGGVTRRITIEEEPALAILMLP